MMVQSGPPIGGVGAGKAELFEDLTFRNITINNNIDVPITEAPGGFFALAVDDGTRAARWKLGSGGYGMPGLSGDFDVRFPHVLWRNDGKQPVSVKLTAFSPLIPYNLKDSSLPVALFRLEITNTANEPVDVCAAFSWQNILNCGGSVIGDWAMVELPPDLQQKRSEYKTWKDVSANCQERIRFGGYEGLRFFSASAPNPVSAGEYALLASGGQTGFTALEAWDAAGQGADFTGAFTAQGFEGAVYQSCQEPAAAAALHGRLMAGEHREMRFALAWHMPNLVAWYLPGIGERYGHYHDNFFAGAAEVAAYALDNFDRLLLESGEIARLLHESSLPRWMTQKLTDCIFPILSNSWFTRDGKFSISEAPTDMGGCMGTIDQRTASHTIYTAFFPELDSIELEMFRRTQGEDGSIAHDVGWGDLGSLRKGGSWVDLPSSFVLQAYHHYLWTGDREFIDRFYPTMLAAVRFLKSATADADADGVPDADCGTTYDAYSWHGATAFVGTLYLAALRAVEQLAESRGDGAAAEECRSAFARCRASLLGRLWNGRWFGLYNDDRKSGKVCGDICSGQLAGQWLANLLGLGDLFDRETVVTCLDSIRELCLDPVPYAVSDVANDNGVPQAGIKDWICSWVPYVEAYLAATAYECGRPDIGLDAFRRCRDVVYEADRRPWEARLVYDVNTGSAIWGRWYMTAPASWAVYWSMLGFGYSLPDRWLRLAPDLPRGETSISAPVFCSAFWGWMRYHKTGNACELAFSVTRALKPGHAFDRIVTSIPAGTALAGIEGGALESTAGNRVTVLTHAAVKEGITLNIKLYLA